MARNITRATTTLLYCVWKVSVNARSVGSLIFKFKLYAEISRRSPQTDEKSTGKRARVLVVLVTPFLLCSLPFFLRRHIYASFVRFCILAIRTARVSINWLVPNIPAVPYILRNGIKEVAVLR